MTQAEATQALPVTQDPEVLGRFWSKVDKRGADECWEWTGSRNAKGYPVFGVAGRSVTATRLMLALSGKPRPSDKHKACHRCDNPPCCNPDHIFPGSHAENLADMAAKGRGAFKSRTHCFQGHEYTPENTRIRMRDGVPRRICRMCQRAYTSAGKAKRRAKREGAEA